MYFYFRKYDTNKKIKGEKENFIICISKNIWSIIEPNNTVVSSESDIVSSIKLLQPKHRWGFWDWVRLKAAKSRDLQLVSPTCMPKKRTLMDTQN